MASWEKILEAARNNPKGVRLSDVCKLAEAFDFTPRRGGKHPNIYKRKGFFRVLNFQDAGNGMAKKYQVQQLLTAIDEINADERRAVEEARGDSERTTARTKQSKDRDSQSWMSGDLDE